MEIKLSDVVNKIYQYAKYFFAYFQTRTRRRWTFLEFPLVRHADAFSVGGALKRSPHIRDDALFVEGRGH